MIGKMDWLNTPVENINEEIKLAAEERQNILTKPAGSLGRLEDIAIQLSGMQGSLKPEIENVNCSIFAADHGVANEGVSAFPQVVTGEMIRNFTRGGAAICVLTKSINAKLEVINLGTVNELEALEGVKNAILGAGTANFANEPAMNEEQLSRAMAVGRQAVERARLDNCQLFIGGDMGIANTTSATAIACAVLDLKPVRLAGPGTGLDAKGVSHKAEVVARALALHEKKMRTPLDVLQCVGGFEIAALTGAYISCAHLGIPALVDGFITSSAALLACRLIPGVEQWLLYSHTSAEPGHRLMLEALNAKPLLNFNMRLGEGSGAATAVPIIQLACKLHNEMASFEEANVSNNISDED